jgi:hypothetical protein
MSKLENTARILYRGVDWLRIGYYLESHDRDLYKLFLQRLKDIIHTKEYEERFINLETLNPFTGEIEDIPFRVKTTSHIYPYVVMLVYEPLNISIRLGRPLNSQQLDQLRQGLTPTPNLMVEITGTALRPQKLFETQKVLTAIFLHLQNLATLPTAFTFSRIDYALDFPSKEPAIDLLLEFRKLRKITLQTEDEKITLSKSVKKLKETLKEYADICKHIGVGDPRRLLLVYYKKTNADRYLQEIYYAQDFIYELQTPHRIEARFNTSFFTNRRKIYFLDQPSEAIDLENLIREATATALSNLPEKFKKFAYQPHELFLEPHQLIHRQTYDRIFSQTHKVIRKLNLQEEALRLLSQLLRIKNEWNASLGELITILQEMIKSEHIRILKKAKEKKMHPADFLSLLPKECK